MAQDAQSVLAACREKLESNFAPSYLQVLEEVPKTASEKSQERILLRQFDPTRPTCMPSKSASPPRA